MVDAWLDGEVFVVGCVDQAVVVIHSLEVCEVFGSIAEFDRPRRAQQAGGGHWSQCLVALSTATAK